MLLLAVSTSCSQGRSVVSSSGTVISDYLTPLMFGAKGDGKNDDTDAMRKAFYESHRQGKILYIPSGYQFRVTGTLNYYQGQYQSYISSNIIDYYSTIHFPKQFKNNLLLDL